MVRSQLSRSADTTLGPTHESPRARSMRRRGTRAPSQRTSEARQIGDQVVQLRVGDPSAEARHQALAELLVELLQIALAVRVKLVRRVAQLNGEWVLVDAHATHLAAIARHDANRKELDEAAARDERQAARQRLGRTDNRLTKVRSAALQSNLGQIGTEAAPLTGDNVAGGAAESRVDLAPALRVSRGCAGRPTAERSHIGDDLFELGVGEAAHAWHAAVRSEEHTSELQSRFDLVCRLLLEKKKIISRTFSAQISELFWKFSMRNALRPVQARNHSRHASHDLCFVLHAPRFRYTMRQRIRLP